MAAKLRSTTRHLSERDCKVIDHVARYRVTIVPALRASVLPELSPNAIAKIANRLTAAKYLQKFTLLHPTRYFVLGDNATAMLGRCSRQAPGSQSLPTDFAVLAYATLGAQSRLRMLRSELSSLCPWLPSRLTAAPYCFDTKQETIELLRVDLGGSVDHVARKCAFDLRIRLAVPGFQELIAHRKFRLVVISATRDKSAAIRKALNRHEWPESLAIHLSVVPQLLSLTARSHHA